MGHTGLGLLARISRLSLVLSRRSLRRSVQNSSARVLWTCARLLGPIKIIAAEQINTPRAVHHRTTDSCS